MRRARRAHRVLRREASQAMEMERVLKYDIHGLVRVESNVRPECLAGPLPPFFITGVGRWGEEADISIFAGDFSYDGTGGIYQEGPLPGPLRSKFLLDGLEGRARIYFLSPRYRWLGQLKQEIKDIVLEVLELKLLQKGHTFIHAACLAGDSGEAIMLVAPPDTGKTFTTIRLVLEHGLALMSDDMTILGPGGQAYCFPTPMTIHPVHVRELGLRLPRKLMASARSRWILLSTPWVKRAVSELRLSYRTVLGDVELVRRARVERIFFLGRGRRGLRRLDKEEAARKLVPVAKMHRSILDDLITIYSYYHPEVDLRGLARRQDELYDDLLSRVECYAVSAPDRSFADIIVEAGLI